MGLKIKQKNPGAIQELIKKYGKGSDIAVGLPAGTEGASAQYPDGAPLLDIATYNEFGIGVPERSFLRSGIRNGQGELGEISEGLIKKINAGEIDIKTASEAIGLKAASIVSQYIVDLDSPPNAESTKKRKKSSNPLVDTTLLSQSITHEVREK